MQSCRNIVYLVQQLYYCSLQSILIVGWGGANGVTLQAALIANRKKLSWESASPWGRVEANLLGCITQLNSKGGSGGYKENIPLSNFCDSVVGGWDIRPTQLGDALYEAKILDYDLVRQIREEMNSITPMKGIWDPDFIGESQHETATNTVPFSLQAKEKLQIIRNDIESFRRNENIDGHITVIWSASVERLSARNFETPEQFFEAIEQNDSEVSPSMLYALAAVMEGCSFVNGGSQNTLCPALTSIAIKNSCYVLGTDYKAGQTKFKTAAVEYIRSLGLTPKVIASSNHLGNNDMKSLTSKKTLDAKIRVKRDIFGHWEENIDHQVRVMYTPMIGDEKRDIVEYTSVGFMNCMHTMLTYTRAMDSALCSPLMIDSAVWLDVFARFKISHSDAVKATAYLFKVPEGGAEELDPGFFKQMQCLQEVADKIKELFHRSDDAANSAKYEMAAVVCAGLSCLDLQLCDSTLGVTHETINTFKEAKYCAGGSCPQVASALASIGIRNVIAITKVGNDPTGRELVEHMKNSGVDCSHIITGHDDQTALAVLPIYSNMGGRGCFVNLAANTTLTVDEVLEAADRANILSLGVFHFGYPHFIPRIQGENLYRLFSEVRSMFRNPIISLDLNGVDNNDSARNKHEEVLGASYESIDLLHANLEEAEAISGVHGKPAQSAEWFLIRGVKIIAITMGSLGAHVAAAKTSRRWAGETVTMPAFPVKCSSINANGAGDAFVSGMIASFMWQRNELTLEQAVRMALLCAAKKIEGKENRDTIEELISLAIQVPAEKQNG